MLDLTRNVSFLILADICGELLAASEGEGFFPYNGLYGEAVPESDAFLRFQVYNRDGISLV